MSQVRSIWRRDRRRCWLCLKEVPQSEASRDHVRPRALGGYDKAANYRLTHIACNTARIHLPPEEVTKVRESLGRTYSRHKFCEVLRARAVEWDREHRDQLNAAAIRFPFGPRYGRKRRKASRPT